MFFRIFLLFPKEGIIIMAKLSYNDNNLWSSLFGGIIYGKESIGS